ncbi:MAG: type IV pilus assembly protein PilM, partial [Planctomycetota bacterium]
MASRTGGVWAIDIGNNSLKAIHLSDAGGVVEVTGFDNIQHGKILAGSGVSDAERDELVAISLREFLRNNILGKDDVVVSVPGQNSFARFVKLPPVEKKRIPEIVSFEAAQQIPFDINDVQWDWQLMDSAEEGQTEVGIFAIKNAVVTSSLTHFSRENIQVSHVQMSPMALYNYIVYDRPDLVKSNSHATVILNIGAENTDLVVCTRSGVWQRCIPMGGNTFTKAIADAFKLNFEKAEKLKRTAAMSKYARQILQAMKPVFTDLASEIQRSLGFYSTSNPQVKLSKAIALGGGTKMRGLLAYLQQSLQIPITRPDSFKKLTIGSNVSAAKFHENICDFGVVYGLALQGLGLGKIGSNLLPRKIARSMAWASKAKYFTMAACMLLMVVILGLLRVSVDKISYEKNKGVRLKINSVISIAQQASQKLKEQQDKGPISEAKIQEAFSLFEQRDVIPLLYQTIFSTLPNEKNTADPEQKKLYLVFANNDVLEVLKTPRNKRKQIFITGMSMYFANNIDSATFPELDLATGARGRYEDEDEEEDITEEWYEDYQPISTGTAEVAEVNAGFVVTIVGYSPYEKIGELLDPMGVENDRSRWGVVTRLMHLDEISDGNSLFSLYNKTKIEHYKLETGEVALEQAEILAGIGVWGYRTNRSKSGATSAGISLDTDLNNEEILIDPMTKEIISKVSELDENGYEKKDRLGK